MALYFMLFILVTASIFFVGCALFAKPKVFLHLKEDIYAPVEPRRTYFKTDFLSKFLKSMGFLTQPISRRLIYLKRLKNQTEILRIKLDVPELIALKMILGLLLGTIIFVFLPKVPRPYALLALVAGFFLPDFAMLQKIRKKKEEVIRCFPETVDLLDMCISAGADLISAIKWIIEKSDSNAFIEQLGVVLSEIQVGKPRIEALKDMAKRLNLADVSSFSRAIIQAERMGTSIEETFRNLSDDTRNRRFQMGERYAIKASLKILFPLLFCILPAIMIVVAGPIIIKFAQGGLTPTMSF